VIVAERAADLRAAARQAEPTRGAGRVGLVPTMGALHRGHASLLSDARGRCDVLVASVFVNPLQFGPGEDLDRYPRTFDADLALCEEYCVDLVFAPSVEEVYPGGTPAVTVDPGPLGDVLEGETRPGHFRGVLTVVAKLFGLVRPDLAMFGEKDYQQLTLLTQMVRDLCLPVEVLGPPTVRDPDGLALSSRNRYLSPEDRGSALAISRGLHEGVRAAGRGRDAVLAAASEVLAAEAGLELDYLALRDPLLGPAPDRGPARLLVAAEVGTTRLIDNVAVDLGRVAS
jgi:pantoate--beta-alanine ligase